MRREPKPGELQAAAIRIAESCQVPSHWLEVKGQNKLWLKPDPGSAYEQVDCVLAGIKELPFKVGLGFVGNEAYRTGPE